MNFKKLTNLFSSKIQPEIISHRDIKIPIDENLISPNIILHRGIKIPIDENLISPNIVEKLRRGRYENNEADQLKKIIIKDEVILEIGGGIGFISCIAALNPNTRSVEVFEANPNLKPLIEAVHALNGVPEISVTTGVLMHHITSPTVPFYLHKDFWASSLSPRGGDLQKVDVPTFCFNSTIEKIQPTLIICDIEGGEMDLFEHANLDGVGKVLIEIHQKVVGGENIKRLFDMFSQRNFHYNQHHSCGSVILFSRVA